MSILVIVEHDNQVMQQGMRNVLTAALALGKDIHFLIAGYNCNKVVEQVATMAGLSQVLVADDARYEHPTAEQICDLILSNASGFSYLLALSSTFGKNILPRIAAKLDVTQVSDVTAILDGATFEHPIYAGNAIETVKVLDEIKVLSIRGTAFEAVTAVQSACPHKNISAHTSAITATFIAHDLTKSVRPDLGNAKIVVSGGRGLQSAEKFKLIETLADVLGAAVGASRAAVDAGFVPNDYQVGQTGRVVAPSLYIAIGISGAIQHLAGMKDSKTIVAINKDADAPIFQLATYGLVGDLFEIVPELIEKLKAL